MGHYKQNRCSRFLAVLVVLGTVNVAARAAETIDQTVERGLAFLAESGQSWIRERECVTCHQIPSLIWSHRVAATRDFTTDERLADWEAWSTDVVSFVKPEQKDDVDFDAVLASNIDTAAQLLLAIPREENGEQAEWREAFADRLAQLQAADGSWSACGQLPLQKRSEKETHAVTTLWTSLALLNEGTNFNHSAALEFSNVESPQSIEWYAARLLVLSSDATGETEAVAARKLQEQIVAQQNADGGWGWKKGDASDALGTGFALYALKYTGAAEPAAIKSANDFLVKTQQPNGSWKVPGTKQSAKGRVTGTASDWGSAWAVIALCVERN